jgi:hypothetical protein
MSTKEPSKYLEVLYDAVNDWPGKEHELIVAFPKQYQDSIADILNTA